MNKRILPYIIAGAAMIAAIAVVAVLIRPNNAPSANGHIKVVAGENFWGDIAKQIGGDRVDVTSIIADPSADPHLYESGAKDASVITNADVVIVNGLGYDDFIDKILAASPNSKRVVIKVSDVLGAKDGDNPHLWYDIGHVGLVATEFQKQFAAKDKTGSDTYTSKLSVFVASLQPLYDRLNHLKAAYPNAPVAYTERVPGYLLQQAGLDVKTPPTFASAIEDGNEPSPTDEQAMIDLITGKKIRALLYNAQAGSPVTEHIRTSAEQNNIPVVPVTETIPAGKSHYQDWQVAQLDALVQALDNTK